MSGIAFLSNWERTDTWLKTGEELVRRGVAVFFIVTRDAYFDKALAAGFPRDNILWLTRQGAKRMQAGDADRALQQEYEAKSGERVRDFILMDRFMRSEDPAWAERYALYAFREILDFVTRHDIRVMSGQPDNILDLTAGMILKMRGGHYLAPFEMRLPARRFVLWDSKIEKRPHVTGAATPADVSAEELAEAKRLRDLVRGGAKMRQLAAKGAAPSIGTSFLRKLVRGLAYRALIVARHDAYMYTPRSVLFDLKYHMVPINHRRLRAMWRRLFEQPVAGERFVYYTLNYSPEHTIDVEAPHFVSAEETVRNIARSLPLGVKLYVKEHPSGIGIRGPAALRRLKRLPGVRLIDPFVDSHELIKRAELTVSLSGTASLEAALYGRPCAIVSDIFIQNFSTCRRLGAPWEVGDLLARCHEIVADEDRDLRYLAWLVSNSHPGTVIEPLVDPDSLGPQNIGQVADAYMKVMRVLS